VIHAVADTNTLVSDHGWRGTPGAIVDAAIDGRLQLVVSPALLDELARVLRYPKLAPVFEDPGRIVTLIVAAADTVEPAEPLDVLADEPDNRILEAATAGAVDIIVTRDHRFRDLGAGARREGRRHRAARRRGGRAGECADPRVGAERARDRAGHVPTGGRQACDS
jgi:putative PIN family toxin of toxin-antitoxin system